MSDDHFTVDGTLIQAWASQKSFRKKGGSDNYGTNFHDSKRSNDTHESTTVPDAQLYKKSYGSLSGLCAGGEPQRSNRSRDGHGGYRGCLSCRWLVERTFG